MSLSIKFDTKFNFNLETNYRKLFENRKKVHNIPTTHQDTKTIFHNAPYTQYKQIKLNNNFRKYLETSLK